MPVKNIEKSYKSLLSIDYSLLCDLLDNDNEIVCFIEMKEDFGTYRKMFTAKPNYDFDGLILAFLPEHDPERKSCFMDFCRKSNLTFIKP